MRIADAVLVIGYTGLAYIDEKPTDNWIVEMCWAQPMGPGMGSTGSPPFLWQVVERLRTTLAQRMQGAYARYNHEIIINGVQFCQTGRPRQFFCLLSHESLHPGQVQVTRVVDRNPDGSSFQRHWIGQFSRPVVQELREFLMEHGRESPEVFLAAMIKASTKIAQKYPNTVGADLMAVHLHPTPGKFTADVTYIPVKKKTNARAGQEPSHPVYSPWFVTPGMYFSPALVTGHEPGWITNYLDIKMHCELLAPMESSGVTWGSHPRLGPPRR